MSDEVAGLHLVLGDEELLVERAVADVVEDQIVAFRIEREVLLGVVDYKVRAERSDHLHVPGAADAGDFCT